MTDKERIEEIAKAREHFNYGISHDIFKEPVTSYAKAAIEGLNLMEDIISKDLVVLSKEEYTKDFCSQFNKGYERGSKETARYILKEILFVKGIEGWQENKQLVEFGNRVVDKIEELAEHYGVEVTE
jgi:hypothetical protein